MREKVVREESAEATQLSRGWESFKYLWKEMC
jgi:hypothetical protein